MNRPLAARVVLAVMVGTLFSSVFAEDWAEFRGPNGQGIATAKNLPTEWDKTKNVVWKQAIPGLGWSSPVLVNGRIYLTTAVPIASEPKPLPETKRPPEPKSPLDTNVPTPPKKSSDSTFPPDAKKSPEAKSPPETKTYSLQALCLSASDGKLLWNTEIFLPAAEDTPKIHGKNSHASPSALVDGNRVFVHFGHQGTACLDLQGKILWKTSEIKYAPVHGNGCTPILADGALIFSCDGKDEPFVVALDADSGKVRWKTPRDNGNIPKKFAFATSQLITVNGQPQVISVGANMVGAYDPKSGREIWRAAHPGYSVIPRPVYGHGLVFISSSYDSPVVMAIRPDGKGDVTESHVEWTLKKGAPHTPSLLLIGDELYMVSDKGVATCVDAKTGKEIWQERIGGNFSASPLYADGKIYLQSEEGVATVFLPGKTFEKLASNDIGERTLASYAVTDGAIFIRTAEHLFRIGGK